MKLNKSRIMKFISLIVAAFLMFSVAANNDKTKVVMIQIMFRHGARSYLHDYPAETVDKSHWDKFGGYGSLTDVGNKNLYELGNYIQNHYKLETLNCREIEAVSTNFTRTIDSTKAFLKPFDCDKIPISTGDHEIFNSPCPRYKQLKSQAHNSPEYLALAKKYEDFIQLMATKSGIKDLSFYHMWEIADHYLVNLAHGLPISNWVLENLENILRINDFTFYIDFLTVEMGRLVSGLILNDIGQNFKSTILNQNYKKLHIYGAHDNYIAAMQKLLDFSDIYKNPEFASSYVFELRKDSSSNYFVKILFRNDKFNEGINYRPVTIKGCEELCPVDRFFKLSKAVNPVKIIKMCEESSKNQVFKLHNLTL